MASEYGYEGERRNICLTLVHTWARLEFQGGKKKVMTFF